MRVVTFGEAMLRFSPPSGSSLERSEAYVVHVAGAEANVAVALARLGVDARWVTRLPRNALGRRVAGKVREHGVDTSHIIWTDDGRVGLYFVEVGAPPRLPHVIYDRRDSAFTAIMPGDIQPDALEDADVLHVTGITPALGATCWQAVDKLVRLACSRGISVSFDLNYRAKLSSPADARAVAEDLIPLVQFLFVSSTDAAHVLNVDGRPDAQVHELAARYPDATIVITAGEEGAWACSPGHGGLHHRPIVPGVTVDRIGRGDALCAGYLFGHFEKGPEFGLACGTALASLAQTFEGDLAWITGEDVLALTRDSDAARYR